MAKKILLRGDTKANWLSANPILMNREVVVELDTRLFKIGNGINHYSDLSYTNAGNGGPNGVYDTYAALIAAYPAGDPGIYVVKADNYWYYWNGSAWTQGGLYQASSSNSYNVTVEVPLGSGYYTLSSGIAAVPSANRRKGLKMTFEVSANNWETYQFKGTSTSTWSTISDWQRIYDKDDYNRAAPQITFAERVSSDSGTQFDVDLAMQAFEKMKAADASTVFTFMPHMASKVRTSGLNRYLSKMYSAKDATYDAAQDTEATQPFVGGYIAPNSKRGLKFVQGQTQTGLMDFTDKVYAAGDSWTLTKRVKINNKGASRVYLGSSYLLSDSTGVTLHNGTTAILVGTYVFECGKTYTIEFQYSNGAGLILVNGLPVPTTATSGAVTFGQISYNATYPFDRMIYYVHLTSERKSASQSKIDHDILRAFFPEVEGIGIGNQFWATSNFEGTVAGEGTVIPEVQGANTDGNAELLVNGDFESSTGWTMPYPAVFSITGGKAVATAHTDNKYIERAITIKRGVAYRITIVTESCNASGFILANNVGASLFSTFTTYTQTSGTQDFYGVGLVDSSYIRIYGLAASAFVLLSISIKEVGASDSTLVYNYVYAATSGTAAVKDLAATKAAAMWCHYDNLATNGAIYGKLYNWYAVHLFDLYPPMRGWRVPTKADFDQLIAANGGSTVAGGKLKAKFGWFDNAFASNESGFSMISSGARASGGAYTGINTGGRTWSSDKYRTVFESANTELAIGNFVGSESTCYSIRMIRNEPNGADSAIWTTGNFTTDIASTAKVLTIPCGYRVRAIWVLSANNLTNIAVNVYDYANTTLIGNILTGKSVTANIESIFTATQIDAPTPYQDRNLRITATGNASPGMTVMAFLEKILKPIAN